jgi:hypothetical protein
METILIIRSVLSTLGVVAIVLSIVSVVKKLKGKVDIQTMSDLEKSLREEVENNYRLIDKNVEDIHNRFDRKIEILEDLISKVDRRIDSRSDKLVDHMCREMNVLHDKIDNESKSDKKLLND